MRPLAMMLSGLVLAAVTEGCGDRPAPGGSGGGSAGGVSAGGGSSGGGSSGGGSSGGGSSGGGSAGGGSAGGPSCPAPSLAYTCNATTGLAAPRASCSVANPCMPLTGGTITTPFTTPVCHTTVASRPMFDDGAPRTWTDPMGHQHAACVFTPPAASSTSKRPLVVFMPGTFNAAGSVYDTTSLRSKAATFDLVGDGTHLGFVLASANERNVQNPTSPSFAGAQWDCHYRDLGSPSCNPDVNGVDQLIDDLVATGVVDPKRIYLMGWSAGATFSQLYGIARHTTPTPGGNRVAAVSSYAGFDPFNNLSDTQSPSCQLSPYPTTTLPVQMVHRACDSLVACNALQRAAFGLPPGDDVEGWLTLLSGPLGDPVVDQKILDYLGSPAAACTSVALCSALAGFNNHIHWPDGVGDNGGIDSENLVMLPFLRAHPRP